MSLAQIVQNSQAQQTNTLKAAGAQAEQSRSSTNQSRRTDLAAGVQANANQDRVDAMGKSLMSVSRHLNEKVSAAKGTLEKLKDQLAQQPAAPEGSPSVGNDAYEKAERLHQVAIDERNNFISKTLGTPGSMAIIKNMSLATSDVTSEMFSQEVYDSMSPSEQAAWTNNWTQLIQAEKEMAAAAGQQTQDYELEQIRARNEGRATLAPKVTPAGTPDKSIFDSAEADTAAQFEGTIKEGVGNKGRQAVVVENFQADLGQYRDRTNELEDNLSKNFKGTMSHLFSSWNPDEGMSVEEQRDSTLVENFTTKFDQLKGVEASQPIESDFLDSLQRIVDSGDPRRIGIFINTMKGYMSQPTLTVRQPVPSAQSGSN